MKTNLRIAFASVLLFVVPIGRADEPKATTRAKYETILADYNAAMKTFRTAVKKAKTEKEAKAFFKTLYPDTADYSRRFVDLAASDPADPASRDALIWVLMQCLSRHEQGPFKTQVGRAVDLLSRHSIDDLGIARTALALSDRQSPNFDRLFTTHFDQSKTREVKGIMGLVMARHLHGKAELVNMLRREPEPLRAKYEETDESGKTTTKLSEPIFETAYEIQLRALDLAALDHEAERFLERVIVEYADIPYIVGTGGPRTERSLARKRTLGQEAEVSLDEIRNLAIGKPAPEIEAACLDGKMRKLSDYRGKVVALVFWGSWCGPCMGEVPHERKLAERLKDRPFTILGVDSEVKQDDGLKAVRDEKMIWPQFFDGVPGDGPIVARYHVHHYPSVFVIDAKGVIRFKETLGEELDKAVEELLKEAESSSSA